MITGCGRCFAGSAHVVWIGTEDGLLRYDTKTDRWTRLGARDGLPTSDVTSIVVDRDSLWVGTTGGVSRLERVVFDMP